MLALFPPRFLETVSNKIGHHVSEVAGCAIGSARSGRPVSERVSQPLPYETGGSPTDLVVDTLESRSARHICSSAYFAAASYASRPTEYRLDRCFKLQEDGSGLRLSLSERVSAG